MNEELVVYTTKSIPFLKRLWESGKLPPLKSWQLKQIVFEGDVVEIYMRNGTSYKLQQGTFKATDNILGTQGSYYIIIKTDDGRKITIYGSDGELTEQEWEDVKLRLNCKNRVGLLM